LTAGSAKVRNAHEFHARFFFDCGTTLEEQQKEIIMNIATTFIRRILTRSGRSRFAGNGSGIGGRRKST
jgi:hypothetical protein